MTDKLIEQIKASRSGKGSGPWTHDMEARILADAEVIKAAEELAVCICHVLDLDREVGTSITVHNITREALAAFRQAQARAALEEKNDDQ